MAPVDYATLTFGRLGELLEECGIVGHTKLKKLKARQFRIALLIEHDPKAASEVVESIKKRREAHYVSLSAAKFEQLLRERDIFVTDAAELLTLLLYHDDEVIEAKNKMVKVEENKQRTLSRPKPGFTAYSKQYSAASSSNY